MSDLRTLAPDRAREEQRGWDYGDFPYGLEPLIMPPAGPSVLLASPPGVLAAYDLDRTWAGMKLEPGITGLALPDNPDTLYWFRWITGHQVTMLLWHLMATLVGGIADGEMADDRTLAGLESCTDGYTAMLQYSGSCSPELYRTLIRPRMYLQHRAFSGLWAADFAPLRRLLRGHAMPWMTGPRGAGLAAAVTANRAAHEAVAARLVPDGVSLLQRSVADTAVRPTPRTAAIFDSFFMTTRAPVGLDAVVAQLLHRVRAVALDLAANGCGGLSTAEAMITQLRRVVAHVADLPRPTT